MPFPNFCEPCLPPPAGGAAHGRAAHVNRFTRRGWRKRYKHQHARPCAPILSGGSGAHSRDHAVDRTGGGDLGAVAHRRPLLRFLLCRGARGGGIPPRALFAHLGTGWDYTLHRAYRTNVHAGHVASAPHTRLASVTSASAAAAQAFSELRPA